MSSLKKCAGWMGLTMLLYGCGGGTSNGQNGANDQPGTLTALDGTADQGCYGCILDVGTDSSPSMGEDKGEGETINGDANVSSGCQSDNQCADEIDCTVDTCLPNGACQSMPDDKLCDDGEVCDIEHDGCFKAKSCFNDEQCDDSVDCTVEGCNTETKLCYPAIKDDARCEDGFVCLPEHPEANPLSGCVDGSHCEKDADCVSDFSCLTGQCLLDICEWTPDDEACDDNNVCNGDEVCEITKGCQSINPLVCDDQIACTKDDCEPDEGCIHEPTVDCASNGRLIFSADLEDDQSIIVIYNLATKEETSTYIDGKIYGVSWHNSQNSVIFATAEGIQLMNAQTTTITTLYKPLNGIPSFPDVAIDGTIIFYQFCSWDLGCKNKSTVGIYFLDQDGEISSLDEFVNPYFNGWASASWSPIDSTIILVETHGQLNLLAIETSSMSTITTFDNDHGFGGATWLPDGHIIYSMNDGIYTIKPDEDTPTKLFDCDASDCLYPAPSSMGSFIAFVKEFWQGSFDHSELWISDLSGTQQTKVTLLKSDKEYGMLNSLDWAP